MFVLPTFVTIVKSVVCPEILTDGALVRYKVAEPELVIVNMLR